MKSKKQHSRGLAAEDRPLPPSNAVALAVSTDLLWQAIRAEAPDTFVGWAVSAIAAAVGADYAALATAADGRWATVAQWSAGILPAKSGRDGRAPVQNVPAGRIAGRRPRQRSRPGKRGLGCRPAGATHDGGRGAGCPSTRCTALTPGPSPEGRGETGGCLTDRRADSLAVLHQALTAVRRRASLERRLRRLEAVAEIASQWNQVREIEPLLGANGRGGHAAPGGGSGQHLSLGPAEPHARRPARAGHPRRRIAHPRRPRRGGRSDPQRPAPPRRCRRSNREAIDRNVDAQLHYQTRTLLCVPLRGRSGELFGAFELINKLSGAFTQG